MAQPSEETKKSATSMAFGRLSKTALASARKTISTVGRLFTKKPDNLVDESSPPTKIMGEIYKMMKLMDLDRKLNQEMANSHIEEQNHLRNQRNKEIIKALTTPKIRKPRVVKPKRVKTQETETTPLPPVSKTPTKQMAPTQPSTPPTQAPATPPKTTKPKTAEPAKEIAGPPKPTAAAAPPAAPSTPSISTTAKIVGGTAAVVVGSNALAATSNIAESIAKYESKTSSPLRTKKGNIKTKWKNDSEYNAYNKGTKNNKIIGADFDENNESVINFSDMTIEEYLRRGDLSINDPNKLFAVGRYQIIPTTMHDIVNKLKINPKNTKLTPDIQDMLFTEGLIKRKRPIVDDYLNGKPGVTRDMAVMELAKEFASIGIPYDLPARGLKKGQSFYEGTGGNAAHNKPEDVGTALDADKLKILEKNKTIPVPNNKGVKLQTSSVQGQDLKKDMAAQQEKMQSQQTTNILAQAPTEPQVNLTKPNDSNPLLDKVRAG